MIKWRLASCPEYKNGISCVGNVRDEAEAISVLNYGRPNKDPNEYFLYEPYIVTSIEEILPEHSIGCGMNCNWGGNHVLGFSDNKEHPYE